MRRGAPDRRVVDAGPLVRRPGAGPPYIIRTVSMRVGKTVEKLTNVHRRGHFHPKREGNRMTAPVFEEFDPASDCDRPGAPAGDEPDGSERTPYPGPETRRRLFS